MGRLPVRGRMVTIPANGSTSFASTSMTTTSRSVRPGCRSRVRARAPRFRLYRENMRWQSGDVIFVTLNVPGDNNHYLNEGGRNGEFEERSVANTEWLERAEAYARRAHARAIVIAFEGDPQFEAGRA